jgi:Fe-S oxidoreductase
MPGEKPYIDKPSVAPQPKDLLPYLGCNVLRTAHLAKTVISVLKAMGFEFNTAGGPAHCCGIVHHQNNDPKGTAFSLRTAWTTSPGTARKRS